MFAAVSHWVAMKLVAYFLISLEVLNHARKTATCLLTLTTGGEVAFPAAHTSLMLKDSVGYVCFVSSFTSSGSDWIC